MSRFLWFTVYKYLCSDL